MRTLFLGALCLALSVLASSACRPAASSQGESGSRSGTTRDNRGPAGAAENAQGWGRPVHLADLEDRAVNESSGIAASRRNPGLLWTHNDSGDGPLLYAFDRRGRRRGVWRVTDAAAVDWEDIAAGPGPVSGQSYLYVADIGDNDAERAEVIVYRVAEPAIRPADAASNRKNPRRTEPAAAIRLKYPDGAHDAETLLVHPLTGDLYIVTKTLGATTGLYKLAAPFSTETRSTLVRLGTVGAPGLVGGLITGGDISPDGRRVVLCDYMDAYEWSLPGGAGTGFDEVWKQPVSSTGLGLRRQGEAVCYRLDGQAILATSELRPAPLIEVTRAGRK